MLENVVRPAFHRTLAVVALACVLAIPPREVRAGSPFLTGDPEAVEHGRGQLYTAGQLTNERQRYETAPHLQLDYGAFPDVQLHAVVPLAPARERTGVTRYGLGDVELGLKYRFVHEGERTPQIATFPLVLLPTGKDRAGTGDKSVFLPIWLQKTFARWTTYGGGGYWRNRGAGNTNYVQASWLVQRSLAKALTLGTELFYQTKRIVDGDPRLAFNVGATVRLTDDHHLLVSAGRDIRGDNTFAGYLAYRWTFRRREHAGK
jgi:Putative MetA-pathway of phenol degradation